MTISKRTQRQQQYHTVTILFEMLPPRLAETCRDVMGCSKSRQDCPVAVTTTHRRIHAIKLNEPSILISQQVAHRERTVANTVGLSGDIRPIDSTRYRAGAHHSHRCYVGCCSVHHTNQYEILQSSTANYCHWVMPFVLLRAPS